MAGALIDQKNPYVPAGFHGGMDVLLGMRGVVPILHGPGGCTCYVWTNVMRSDCVTRHVCSTVLDDGLIGGGGSIARLRSLIERVKERYAPALIPVVSTHISDTIGEDVEAFVRKLGDERVVYVDARSLQLDEDACKGDLLRQLVDRFAAKQARRPRSVNVLGPSLNTFNWRSDLAELRELLGRLGVEVNAVAPLDCAVEDLAGLPRAALNLVMYSHAVPAAELLQERFGMDWIAAYPVGFEGTIAFVRELEERLGIDGREAVRGEMRRYYAAFSDLLLSPWHDHLSNELRTFAAVGTATQAVAIAGFLAREVAMTPLLVASVDGTSREELGRMLAQHGLQVKTVLARARAAEVHQWLHRLIPSVILGSDYEEKVADDLKASAFIPIAHPSMVTLALGVTPFWGFRGGCHLVQEILLKGTRLLKNIRAISVATRGASIDVQRMTFAREWAPEAMDKYEYVAGLIPRFLGNREEIAQRFISMCERSAPPGGPVQLSHVEASFATIESHFAR